MTRTLAFSLLALGLVSTAAAQQRPVAPPPREVRADGSRDPVPEPAKRENPLEVVERIIKNSKDAGEKLAQSDTGTGTRKTQDQILKDIDALLNPDDPPPMSGQDKDKNQDKDKSDSKDKEKNKDNKSDPDDKKMDMTPMGKGGMDDNPKKPESQPMDGMGGMGGTDPQPMGGDQPRERRPRMGGDQKQDAQPMGTESKGQPKDTQPKGGQPKDPKNTGGGVPDPKGGKAEPSPLLPFEAEVVKDVWGHLPDKLRQQATQFYREEFTARYSELLKMYYSSLAEKK